MVKFTTLAVLLLATFALCAEERKTTERFLEERLSVSSLEQVDLFDYARPDCESNCILTVRGVYQTMVINVDNDIRVLSKPTIYKERLDVAGQRPLLLPNFKDLYLLEVGEYRYPVLVLPNGEAIFGEHRSSANEVQYSISPGGPETGECPERREVDYHACLTLSDGSVTLTLVENVYDCEGNFLRQDIYTFTIPANLAGIYIRNCN
ncbi:MAG: hypothetical protein OXG05_02125 [Gammaproteobacteria bacterium]|nr:hypothetical protein [Gammaproteobacteria bacterium]